MRSDLCFRSRASASTGSCRWEKGICGVPSVSTSTTITVSGITKVSTMCCSRGRLRTRTVGCNDASGWVACSTTTTVARPEDVVPRGRRTAERNSAPSTDAPVAVSRELKELAAQIEAVTEEDLELLGEILIRADREKQAELLEEVEIRRRLAAHMARGGAGILFVVGVGVLVATVMRAGWLAARPFLGFGLLGGLIVLRALQRWYRASEVRERIVLMETEALAAKMVTEEMPAEVR